MWTDLGFNVLLLMMSDYVFVLAVSNVCYLVFNFLNLNAGWIHRIDNAKAHRPWRAPASCSPPARARLRQHGLPRCRREGLGSGTLVSGLVAMAAVVPVFVWRHYIVDKGRFPEAMLDDLHVDERDLNNRRAGTLPYLTLAAGVLVVIVSNWFFQFPVLAGAGGRSHRPFPFAEASE